MAIFHLTTSIVQRARGQSATARIAYIARACITDERTGETHDRRGGGGLLSLEVVGYPSGPALDLPPGVAADRLANAMEAAETRRNSRPARSTILALPAELPLDRQGALLRGYALALRDRYGVACVAAIHPPDARGDHRNTHAHLVETTRRVDPETGALGAKVRELDDRATGPGEMEWRRAEWARRVNAELARAGIAARVDHRSHRRRAEAGDGPPGIIPAQHLGQKRTAKGRALDRCAERVAGLSPYSPRRMAAEIERARSAPWEAEARARKAHNAEVRETWTILVRARKRAEARAAADRVEAEAARLAEAQRRAAADDAQPPVEETGAGLHRVLDDSRRTPAGGPPERGSAQAAAGRDALDPGPLVQAVAALPDADSRVVEAAARAMLGDRYRGNPGPWRGREGPAGPRTAAVAGGLTPGLPPTVPPVAGSSRKPPAGGRGAAVAVPLADRGADPSRAAREIVRQRSIRARQRVPER